MSRLGRHGEPNTKVIQGGIGLAAAQENKGFKALGLRRVRAHNSFVKGSQRRLNRQYTKGDSATI